MKFLMQNHSREAFIIAEAGAKHAVTIATNMAGRGTDIKLGEILSTELEKIGTNVSLEEFQEAVKNERKLPERL